VTYRFLSPAQRELSEAVQYYEKASPGLGLEFLDEIEKTVERILQDPDAWTRVAEHHPRCRTRRFPYGVIYSIQLERGHHSSCDESASAPGQLEGAYLIVANNFVPATTSFCCY
jgi:plasmid stabilization system protein ParE